MLQSVNDLKGYDIIASDGEIGDIEDFFIETDDWSIRYVGVDTRHLLPGKHVLISTLRIGSINWAMRTVNVGLTREKIKSSPDYEKVTEISREYETRLHKHYGQQITN